jgi:hypothetical protein
LKEIIENSGGNVDMTDEEADEYERRMMMEELERRRRRSDYSEEESRIEGVIVNAPEKPQSKEAINDDLE